MILLHGCDGLSARRMAVLWTFCGPSLCRHGRRELLRNTVLDFTPLMPATACHQRNNVETYSRYSAEVSNHRYEIPLCFCASQESIRFSSSVIFFSATAR